MNLWENMRRKNNLTITEIANELGIEEHKVKQIESGARKMPKEKIDEYLEVINKLSKKDRAIKIAEARAWYEQADLNQLIKDFGFKSQRDFAKEFGCEQSSVSVWSNKKRHIGTPTLLKLYYFFNNEFNKKISEDEEQKNVKINEIEKHNKEMQEWYDKTNFIKLLKEKNISQKELCRELDLPFSTFNNWIRKISASKKGIEILYNLFNKEEDIVQTTLDLEETKSEPMITTTDNEPAKTKILIYEDTTEEDLCRLKEENERLRKQIARYEMLIDMAIRKEN